MEKVKKGDYFYKIAGNEKFLRKIQYIAEQTGVFEWNFGWSMIDRLIPNPDKRSKVKFILPEQNKLSGIDAEDIAKEIVEHIKQKIK